MLGASSLGCGIDIGIGVYLTFFVILLLPFAWPRARLDDFWKIEYLSLLLYHSCKRIPRAYCHNAMKTAHELATVPLNNSSDRSLSQVTTAQGEQQSIYPSSFCPEHCPQGSIFSFLNFDQGDLQREVRTAVLGAIADTVAERKEVDILRLRCG